MRYINAEFIHLIHSSIEYKQAERRLNFLIQRFSPKGLDDGIPSSLNNFGSLVIVRCSLLPC